MRQASFPIPHTLLYCASCCRRLFIFLQRERVCTFLRFQQCYAGVGNKAKARGHFFEVSAGIRHIEAGKVRHNAGHIILRQGHHLAPVG